MTTINANSGWLASIKSWLPSLGSSTAAVPEAKGPVGPERNLTTLATEGKPKAGTSRWNWLGTKAPSPIVTLTQDIDLAPSGSAAPQKRGWLSTYNPLSRWWSGKSEAEPTAEALPTGNEIRSGTGAEAWKDDPQSLKEFEAFKSTLRSMFQAARNTAYRSASHMCDKRQLTLFHRLNTEDMEELGLYDRKSKQTTTGRNLKSAMRKVVEPLKDLTTLQSEKRLPLQRKKSVVFKLESDDKPLDTPTTLSPGSSSMNRAQSYLSRFLSSMTGGPLVTSA